MTLLDFTRWVQEFQRVIVYWQMEEEKGENYRQLGSVVCYKLSDLLGHERWVDLKERFIRSLRSAGLIRQNEYPHDESAFSHFPVSPRIFFNYRERFVKLLVEFCEPLLMKSEEKGKGAKIPRKHK